MNDLILFMFAEGFVVVLKELLLLWGKSLVRGGRAQDGSAPGRRIRGRKSKAIKGKRRLVKSRQKFERRER